MVVDELEDLARFTGIKSMERKSIFHALNQKAAAKKASAALNKEYEELQLIVIHLGGGISVGAHAFGKVIDVNNGLDGEGPFSPERAGTLPVGDVIKEAYSGNYTESQLKKRYVGNGGLKSYFETSDTAALEKRKDAGDTEIDTVLRAMVYQTAKEAGAMASVLKGRVDALIVTGNCQQQLDMPGA
nr:butyrate kinase [Sinobaca sp. H24]